MAFPLPEPPDRRPNFRYHPPSRCTRCFLATDRVITPRAVRFAAKVLARTRSSVLCTKICASVSLPHSKCTTLNRLTETNEALDGMRCRHGCCNEGQVLSWRPAVREVGGGPRSPVGWQQTSEAGGAERGRLPWAQTFCEIKCSEMSARPDVNLGQMTSPALQIPRKLRTYVECYNKINTLVD